jgi:hypothetical protein
MKSPSVVMMLCAEEEEFQSFLSVMEDKDFKTKYPKLHEMRAGDAKKVKFTYVIS